ncbi:hypothetical protein SAMN05660293_00560 [Dyadobacter psychrophilus]|uniref:Uncharacterized protein n=1 Tax=Dyadobacter psychrophilus TaxID=651661 RepID=A0A1T5BRN1_9BACT|nr:hypothetical protein SAMN05660293_00560 [Dyadobacter psychrophilus]
MRLKYFNVFLYLNQRLAYYKCITNMGLRNSLIKTVSHQQCSKYFGKRFFKIL